MTIESAPGRAVVVLSRRELEGYGIDLADMSLSDAHTRVMLGDMLGTLAHMGAISEPRGQRARIVIECAAGPDGGCTLFLSACSRRTVRFPDADAVIRAASAGALSKDMTLLSDGEGYILELPEDVGWQLECLIREFTEDSGDPL